MHARHALPATGLLALTLLVGCGEDDEPEVSAPVTPPASAPASPSAAAHGMHGGEPHGGAHGDASGATPAYDVGGAVEASFALLDTAEPGNDGVAGTAWLAQGDSGTTVTARLTGLEPGRAYVSHLHAGTCAEKGGPHFRFDPDGSDTPPNEVHLALTGGADGSVEATATNPMRVGDGARSIVVHPADAMSAKLVCAQF